MTPASSRFGTAWKHENTLSSAAMATATAQVSRWANQVITSTSTQEMAAPFLLSVPPISS